MALFRLLFISDPNKENHDSIQNNLIDESDITYKYFESEDDIEAGRHVEESLLPSIAIKRNGCELEGWAVQRGREGSTSNNFVIDAALSRGLFVTATMRKELDVPQKSHLKEIILFGEIIKAVS